MAGVPCVPITFVEDTPRLTSMETEDCSTTNVFDDQFCLEVPDYQIDCEDNIIPDEPTESDAILKPRIIFTDGFGAGQIQSIGFSVPIESIPNPLTTIESIRDPFNGVPGTGISPLSAISRYSIFSGGSYNLPIAPPLEGEVDELLFFNVSEDWEYSLVGGRGKGYIISKADGTNRPGGHWRFINFRNSGSERSGGIVLGMDLNGITIPDDGISCISFVTEVVPNLSVHGISSPYYGILPALIVTIKKDYNVKIERLNITLEPGHAPDYFGTGTYTLLDTSTIKVPSSGFFGLEAGMYTPNRFTLGESIISANNGFAYVRLYTSVYPFGVNLIRKLNINTSNSRFVDGIAYGSDTRGEFGDGAGNVTRGIPEIKFDSVTVYDNHGSTRGYIYNAIVGTSFPNSESDPVQSTPTGSTRVENIARTLENLNTLETKYNTYTGNSKDLFKLESAKPEAVEILAVTGFKYGSYVVGGDLFSGKGSLIIKSGNIETKLPVSTPAAINLINEILILEKNPNTDVPFEPSEIGSDIKIGWINEKVVPTHGDPVLFQLGLEYVFRSSRVNVDEPASPIPVASFDYVLTNTPGIYSFQDTSVKYDGTIVSNHWNWGDATSSDNVGGQWSGVENAHTEHTFTPGTHNVTLTVTASDGSVGQITRAIVVPNQLPSAGFTFTQAPASLIVDFTDASTDIDGTIVSRLWNFGDLSTSTETNPSHTYSVPGDYTVTLTVTDNNGGQNQTSHIITAPPVSAGCGLSTLALADTPNVQGDDFAGGNPPLPSYANTAAFKIIIEGSGPLGQRDAYRFPNFGPNVGDLEYAIDTVNTFNGRNTLKIGYGAGLTGAGWLCAISDDADPTETEFESAAQWARVIFNADSGIVSDSGLSTYGGVEIVSIYGHKQMSLFIREGRVFQDDEGFSYDLGPESLFVGRVGMGEAIIRFATDSVAHTLDTRVWIGDACSLVGVSPISSHLYTGVAGANLKNDTVSLFSCAFSPSGSPKYAHVSLWETMPTSVSANPYGVSLT